MKILTFLVIFVVDSNDITRLDEAKAELRKVCESPELMGIRLLVFCNKQDLTVPCMKSLDLHGLENVVWNVHGCCAISGEGIDEGLLWLQNPKKRFQATKSARVDVNLKNYMMTIC